MSKIPQSDMSVGMLPKKRFQNFRDARVSLPDLVEPQRLSYTNFIEVGLKEVFKEFSPISDYSEKKFDLLFKQYELG